MLITFGEIIGIIIVTLYLGYLFSAFIKPVNYKISNWENVKLSSLVVAPAVILHELAHKFTAISFGLEATFFAFYQNSTTMFLALFSLLLRFIKSPFIFIIPGFVSTPETIPIYMSLIAFAGPLTNLILFFVSSYVIKNKQLNDKQFLFWFLTKRINIFLFLFNMIPIGPFDGAKVFSGLINHLS